MSSRNRSDNREEIDVSRKCQADPPIDTEFYPPANSLYITHSGITDGPLPTFSNRVI